MIETALVFALGALVSGLIALVVFPAFTRRAARLARRDLEARLPRTLDEVAAMRDAVRAEYAARTARVEATLADVRQALSDERVASAEIALQLSALQIERRGYEAGLADAERRVSEAFEELRRSEEALARSEAQRRDLERQLVRFGERLADAEARASEAERLASEMRMALVAAEASAWAMADRIAARGEPSPSAGAGAPPLAPAGPTGPITLPPAAAARSAPAPLAGSGAVLKAGTALTPGPDGGAGPPGPSTTTLAPPAAATAEADRSDGSPAAEPAGAAAEARPAAPPPARGLPPDVATALAERLREARRRAADERGKAAPEQPPAPEIHLPVAADFTLPTSTRPAEAPEIVPERPAEAVDAAETPSLADTRLPKVPRRFPRSGSPSHEPVVSPRESAGGDVPFPVIVPRDTIEEVAQEKPASPGSPGFRPQPVPVVIRNQPPGRFYRPPPSSRAETPVERGPAGREDREVATDAGRPGGTGGEGPPPAGPAAAGGEDAAKAGSPGPARTRQQPVPVVHKASEREPAAADRGALAVVPAVAAAGETGAEEAGVAPGAADEAPGAGEPPAPEPASGPVSFPPIAAPAATRLQPDDDLTPEERNRRVEDLAARLRSLRSRNAAAHRPVPRQKEPVAEEEESGTAEVEPAQAKS